MINQFISLYRHTMCWSLLLVPALLLSTPNFSVGIIVIAILTSSGYLIIKRSDISLNHIDALIIFCLTFYFIGAIPITLVDGTTARYFQGGVRLLLCLPVYIALSHYLKTAKLPLRDFIEIGVIIGCFAAFLFALYQFFHLKMPRVDGFLFSINFGYLACSLTFIAFSLLFNSNRKVWLSLAFLASIVSVSLTLTRGAIFAIPLLLVLVTILKFRAINVKAAVAVVIIFLTMSFIAYKYSYNFKHRVVDFTIYEFSAIAAGNTDGALSSGYRLQFWLGAIEAFKKSPLIGLPYAQREKLNQQLHLAGKMNVQTSSISRGHAHNQYFEMLASNGSLGLISILAVYLIPLVFFIQHYSRYNSDWAFSGAIFVSGFAIFGLTEVPLTTNLIGSFYGFMLAVFFAVVASEKQTNRCDKQ